MATCEQGDIVSAFPLEYHTVTTEDGEINIELRVPEVNYLEGKVFEVIEYETFDIERQCTRTVVRDLNTDEELIFEDHHRHDGVSKFVTLRHMGADEIVRWKHESSRKNS
jgi:hypothetical protein